MKIGIVGAEGTIKRIHTLIDPDMFFLDIIDYPRKRNEKRFGEFLDEIQKELDGIIFTGHAFFESASRCTHATIPWTYFKRSTNSILCALLKASMLGYDISKITCDLPAITSKELLELLCERLGIEENKISIHLFNETKRGEEYKESVVDELSSLPLYTDLVGAFHLEHFQRGTANICLSTAPSVVSTQILANYPTFLVEISREDAIGALNDIRFRHLERAKRKLNDQQIAVISLKIELAEPYTHVIQAHQQIKGTYLVEQEILSFVQKIGAAVEKTSDLQYMIYTHKTVLHNTTTNLKKMDFTERLLSIREVHKTAVGVGFGETHGDAKRNSLLARNAAKNQLSSCYYISDSNDNVQGPFLIQQGDSQKDYQKIAMERISSETAVGVTVLNTLIKAQKQYGFDRITVGELAEMCGVSFSKMNRIVASLEENGYAKIVGNIARSKTGRPRRLIELKLGFLQNE